MGTPLTHCWVKRSRTRFQSVHKVAWLRLEPAVFGGGYSCGDSAPAYRSEGRGFDPAPGPQLVLFTLGKGVSHLFPLSTEQYLGWVPGHWQMTDLVRLLSVLAFRALGILVWFTGSLDCAQSP